MTPSDKARANALQFECKKDGLKQLQSGEWTLALKVHPADVPAPLLTAAMGTRYMAVLVEVSDDETPVEQPTEQKQADKHRLSRQAAMCCDDQMFQAFIQHRMSGQYAAVTRRNTNFTSRDVAACCVRNYLNIKSRSEIDTDQNIATIWSNLHGEYLTWKGCYDE